MSKRALESIFEAERALREQERALLQTETPELVSLLSAAVAEARELANREEGVMRLERLADLCAQVQGPEMVDALLSILDDDDAGARVAAAEALVDVAFERYAEVARAAERAAERARKRDDAGYAVQELPWVIAEVAEPSARKLITRFLDLKDADAVASAIEALATLGEPEAIDDLRPLCGDERLIHDLEDDDLDGEEQTLGALATEVVAALEAALAESQAEADG